MIQRIFMVLESGEKAEITEITPFAGGVQAILKGESYYTSIPDFVDMLFGRSRLRIVTEEAP